MEEKDRLDLITRRIIGAAIYRWSGSVKSHADSLSQFHSACLAVSA